MYVVYISDESIDGTSGSGGEWLTERFSRIKDARRAVAELGSGKCRVHTARAADHDHHIIGEIFVDEADVASDDRLDRLDRIEQVGPFKAI